MEQIDVERIFNEVKDNLLKNSRSASNPIVYILGGQGSSGKSGLGRVAFNSSNVLQVDGDLYRGFHPYASILIKDPSTYSEKTQVFSNVFTEGLIEEAIKRRVSVSIEGTMRRSEVVQRTIEKFKNASFRVELVCIIAPEEFTAINLHYRYAKEIEIKGEGRLADIQSHNEASKGLLTTLDDAFNNRVVDRIRLYEMFGRSLIADYRNDRGIWNDFTQPSVIALQSRKAQLRDTSLAIQIVERGIEAMALIQANRIRVSLQSRINELLVTLQNSYSQGYHFEHDLEYSSLLDEIDRLTYGVEYFKSKGLDTLWLECKNYNNSPKFENERIHSGPISISQAFRMALDNRSIQTSRVVLDVVIVGEEFHLRLNGQFVCPYNVQEENIEEKKGMKR